VAVRVQLETLSSVRLLDRLQLDILVHAEYRVVVRLRLAGTAADEAGDRRTIFSKK
jgi:hypothetical protein